MKKEESLQQKNKIEESDKKSENGKPETALKPEINNDSKDSKKKRINS